jgi:uncharacterized membrane protein YidH (DUF202 family)
MTTVHTSKFRKALLNAVQVAGIIVAAFAVFIAEIFVFQKWGSQFGIRVLGLVIYTFALIMIGVGLYRLKLATAREPQTHSGLA